MIAQVRWSAPVDPIRIILVLSALAGFSLIAVGVWVMVRAPNLHQHSTASVKFVGMEMTAVGPPVLIILGIFLVFLPVYFWDKVPPVVPQSPLDGTASARSSSQPVPPPQPVSTQSPAGPQSAPTPISPQDAATQLGAWGSVLPHVNELVNSYNSLDLALVSWESKAQIAGERDALSKGVRDAAGHLVSASQSLDKIREQYPQLQDLGAALSNSPAELVTQAASAFADAVSQDGSETDDVRVVRLRQLEGALRLQMGAMDKWMTNLGRTVNLRVRDLSGAK